MSSRFAVKEKRSFIQKTIIYDVAVLSFYECKVDAKTTPITDKWS